MNAKLTLIVCFSLVLSACSPKIDNRGYVAYADWKDIIKVGQTTKQEVTDNFGSPSAQSSFGAETWYYLSSRKETVAFLKPETIEQNGVRITFDASGVVSALDSYDKSQAKDFALVKRVTPTEGHSLGFVEQVLGNIGRFNNPGSGNDSAAPGRRAGRGGL